MKLDNLMFKAKAFAGKKMAVVKKYSPEILVVAGAVGFVGTVVLACKETLKVDDIFEETNAQLEKIKDAEEMAMEDADFAAKYTVKDAAKDKAVVYVKTGVKLVKLYYPAFILGVFSLSAFLGSNKILKNRALAASAAYDILDSAFKKYRQNVIETYGLDADTKLRLGTDKLKVNDEVTLTDICEGEKAPKEIEVVDPGQVSQYAKFFDEASPCWENDAEHNLWFLKIQQKYANDLLHARGHIFLNEVYDTLGIPRTKAGSIVGWVLSDNGDNYVDFGIYDNYYRPKRDFVNGYEKSILLDFNVDGIIWDKI